ncbi:hypothetical protein WR25_16269 isoform W [Diploscapter pachys]|uniref:ABC transmembrane type-1 domain-containing protein n=1 Tax=Diploscapter pachys TaxID=2018661 RepID=A0A2A2L867_9BILA|nr:hypothetical protein WR25_16269 isoform F [Diploscapter pachys]PAV82462.1 hypothetical protein WR25_16269 isoform L [Diploscapter pachys]PAV82466.1 hypothetical protein WR25_16269 isoform P [Diploscapter pachys]PAV82473.1 hypothetical protein WR25_16269 isoform W [Diploscapter pachys]
MGIFLYAFATGKLLAVAEKEDQEVAMWILVCWNLAASMLHPIVFSISIKPVDKIGKSGQEKDSSEASGNSITDGDGKVYQSLEERKIEIPELSTGKISKILAIYALKSWPVLFTALFCLCGYAITRIFVPIYIGRVIHTVAESGKMGDITPTVITLSGIAFTSLLFGGIRGCMFTTLTGLISRDVRRDLFRSLIRQEIAFYDKKPTGDLISRLSSDTSTVINTLTTNLNVCSRNGIMIIGSLIAMLGISWKLTVTCFVTAPAFAIINKYFGRYFDKMAEKTQNALAETTKKAEEVLSQIRTVRSFANEENEAIKYERALEIVVQLNYKRAFAYLFNVWTNEAYQYISLIVVLFYGSYLVIEKQMTAGQLITYFLYQTSLAEYVYGFGTYYVEMMATLGASRNIMQLMFRKPAIDQSAGNLTPEVIGNIELKNVHFTYPSRRNNPILNVRQISLKFLKIDFQDVSLEINKGETVALVGPSGGGKSSIVSLIERFYKPLMGNIYLDGTPINQFEHRYYHRKICLVSQEPQLFSGTIRENIAYGLDECSDEKIIEAAKIANAYDFIMKLEKRFDTECGERGVQLSG